MRHIIVILATLCLALFALAQQPLETAWQREADYLAATRAVTAATDEVNKVKADPIAAPLTLTRAEEALAEAKATLKLTEVLAKSRVFDVHAELILARETAVVTEGNAKLVIMQLDAAKIRRQAGAISEQELRQAQQTVDSAVSKLKDSEFARTVASDKLANYGKEPETWTVLPNQTGPLKINVNVHPSYLKAANRCTEAERALALAKGPDTAPIDLAARERDLKTAKDDLANTERSLRETLDVVVRRVYTAFDVYPLAEQAEKLANTNLDAAKKRHAAGAISKLALAEVENAAIAARQARIAALVECWQAYFAWSLAIGGTK